MNSIAHIFPQWKERLKKSPTLKGDISGGFSSMVVSLPSNIAYGMVAFAPLGREFIGVGILAGMFSSIFAGSCASLFGGTPIMITGPHATSAIIISTIIVQITTAAPQLALTPNVIFLIVSLMVFLSGLLQLLFGFFRLGMVVKYISFPVIVGILNGTAIVMIRRQVAPCLGLPKMPLHEIVHNGPNILPWSILLSVLTVILIINAKKITTKLPASIVGIVGGTIIFHVFEVCGAPLGKTIGAVASSLIHLRHFSALGASTTFSSILPHTSILLNGALIIAIISSIDSLLASVSLQNITNQRYDGNRDLIGQGIGNLSASFFGGLPGTGFIGRSIANYKAGGRTKISGVFSGFFVLIAVAVFSKALSFIPLAVMGAAIMMMGVHLIDAWTFHLMRDVFMKRQSKSKTPFVNFAVVVIVMATLILFDIMHAVIVGIIISIIIFVAGMSKSIVRRTYHGSKYHSKKQRNLEDAEFLNKNGDAISIIEMDGTLFFGATDTLMDEIDRIRLKAVTYIILDFKRVKNIDTTGFKVLEQLYRRLASNRIFLGLSYIDETSPLYEECEASGLLQLLGKEHIFADTDRALEHVEGLLLERHVTHRADEEGFRIQSFLGALGFDRKDIRTLIKYIEIKKYKNGERVFSEGDEGNALFLIMQGLADVLIRIPGTHRKKRVATLTPGTVFGEMALLDRKPRSANIDVQQDLTCLRISVETFEVIKKDHPDIALKIHTAINTVLANRLRDANNLISELES